MRSCCVGTFHAAGTAFEFRRRNGGQVKMFYRLFTLASLISLAACNGVHDPSAVSRNAEPALDATRPVELTVTLTQLTQRPTPAGLPSRFEITSSRIPEPGQKTDI